MQNSTGMVKIGFSIPGEDYEWIQNYIQSVGFHTNISDFTASSILKMIDLISSTRAVENSPDALLNLAIFLQINFYDTIPDGSPVQKIQVRLPEGQAKKFDFLCEDLIHNCRNGIFAGELIPVRRRLAITAIRFYIQYRAALDDSMELPASYIMPLSKGDLVRIMTDINIMTSSKRIDS